MVAGQRALVLQHVIGSLKDVLSNVEAPPMNPYQQQQQVLYCRYICCVALHLIAAVVFTIACFAICSAITVSAAAAAVPGMAFMLCHHAMTCLIFVMMSYMGASSNLDMNSLPCSRSKRRSWIDGGCVVTPNTER